MSRILEAVTVQERFAGLPEVAYGAGETVIAAGSSSGRLFVLRRGAVEVVRDGTVIGAFAEPGSVFGELAALLDQPHSADVRTLEESVFQVADAADLLRRDPLATLYVAVTLARRLHDANTALVAIRRQEAGIAPDPAARLRLDELSDAFFF